MPKIKDQIDNETRATNGEVASPQTPERAEVASFVVDLFNKKRTMRDKSQKLFRDRTLKEMTDDCTKRFIQFKQRPAHKKKWQSNLASTTPYEKLLGILSKIATQGMEAKAVSQEEISKIERFKERILNAMGKASAIKNNDDFQIILEMLEAGEKGTVIGFEDWYHGKRQIREVIDQDPKTGEMKFKVKTIKEWNDVRGSLVNLEDFYPDDLNVRPGMVEDLDGCFLRTIMSEDEFDSEFGKYPDADLVRTNTSPSVNESTPFWKQSDDVGNDEIEVLRRFDKKTDEYVIIANGIWINFVGKAEVQPLPWNHKQLPFWGAVYAPLDANFFFGRSLIDLLIADTDAKDGLFDRMMDQMTLAVSRPVITDNKTKSALTKGFLQPNNVITTDWSSGRPNFDTVPIPDPPNMGVTLLQLLDNRTERVSAAAEQTGGGGVRTKTATQINTEAQGASEAAGFFRTLMEHGIKQKYKLRYPNMLQFYTLPSNNGEGEERFRKVILRNEKVSNGKTGDLQIDIRRDINQARVSRKNEDVEGETEFMEVSPEFIRNFRHNVILVPQSSIKMTDAQKQLLELNYQKVMLELYADKFDRDAGFESLNEAFNKDNDVVKAKGQGLQDVGGQAGQVVPPIGSPQPNIPALKSLTTV